MPEYPPIAPFDSGLLETSDASQIYWETSGNPKGRPMIYLHGGPGGGLGKGGYRRRADPNRHLIVGIDQRGCGRSRPLAPACLATNTTQTLIADIEQIRTYLGIERWLVHGTSWGSTLALAYAQEHPDRVTELVLAAVTTTSREEIDWITEGIGRVFPEAWNRAEEASGRRGNERVIEAFARQLATGEPSDRQRAADAWDDWETTHMSLNPGRRTGPLHVDPAARDTFATLVTHYWSHDAFLIGPNRILTRMKPIEEIPGVLIHGRHDISGPAITPWLLHRRWPASALHIVEHEGHGGAAMMQIATEAIDGFANRGWAKMSPT